MGDYRELRWKLPDGLAAQFEHAMALAEILNSAEGNAIPNVAARRNESLERIVAHFLADAIGEVHRVLPRSGQERLAALEAASFRCSLCGHSRSSGAGVTAVRINETWVSRCQECQLDPKYQPGDKVA